MDLGELRRTAVAHCSNVGDWASMICPGWQPPFRLRHGHCPLRRSEPSARRTDPCSATSGNY
eukprot:11780188-Alexandrium_andersonii.AAC.1